MTLQVALYSIVNHPFPSPIIRMLTIMTSPPSLPPTVNRIPLQDSVTRKWRQIIHLMAAMTDVSAVVLMRALPDQGVIEVFATDERPSNPLRLHARLELTADTYCYHVITSRQSMHIPDTADDPRWEKPPMGMRAYVGVPLLWPDGTVFGSMCMMNQEPGAFAPQIVTMLEQFRAAIESDIHSMVMEYWTGQMRDELLEAQRLARMGSWQWDARADVMGISHNVFTLFGVAPVAPGPLLVNLAYLRQIVHPDDWIDLDSIDECIRYFGHETVRTYRVLHPTEGERWLRSVSAHHYAEDGTLSLIRGTVQDVTDQVHAEEHTREAAIERERAEMLVRFVRDLAHEIKTPLSIMGTSVHVLQRSQREDQRAKHVEKLQQQIMQVSEMVDALTQMARLDTLSLRDRVPVNLAVLLREAISVVRLRRDLAHTLETDIPEQLTLPAAYEAELSVALLNLLDNAFRFTPDGGTVTVTMQQETDAVVIVICDNGIGMDEAVLRQCFDRFYRGDPARTTRGLGMGLPIALKVAELHGGHILAESVPGEGSTFTLVLPLDHKGEIR